MPIVQLVPPKGTAIPSHSPMGNKGLFIYEIILVSFAAICFATVTPAHPIVFRKLNLAENAKNSRTMVIKLIFCIYDL
jgi:hypothetical protein